MRVFHIPGSRSTRALWALEELGAPYEVTVLDRAGKNSPEHHERHPLGRIHQHAGIGLAPRMVGEP